jgi:hypothetical protein
MKALKSMNHNWIYISVNDKNGIMKLKNCIAQIKWERRKIKDVESIFSKVKIKL